MRYEDVHWKSASGWGQTSQQMVMKIERNGRGQEMMTHRMLMGQRTLDEEKGTYCQCAKQSKANDSVPRTSDIERRLNDIEQRKPW